MSSVYTTRVIISSALLMLLIVAGIYIHRTGKPYNSLVFGIHKIFTITLIVILVTMIKNYLSETEVEFVHYLIMGAAALTLAGLLISGGMISLDRLRNTMLLMHHICTAGFLVCYPVLTWIFISNTINK
jgi:hypothetical protein